MSLREPRPSEMPGFLWLMLRLYVWRMGAKLKALGRGRTMRSRKTIRRMKGTPLARKLAKMSIEARSFQRRLDYTVAEVQDMEATLHVYERALREHGWDTGTVGAEIAQDEAEEMRPGNDG